ncbi:hypothetical protein JCM10914_4315 [Paenibacillus sp. JCM 10914]|nr:hypothetical protein JCM10914_4315 [Paenibacillus sp. JCM 10914]
MQNFPEGVISERNNPGRKMLSSLMRSYLRCFLYSGDPNGKELPDWQRWTNGSRSAEILSLDASEEQAIVQLIQKLTSNDILARMEEDTRFTEEQRIWLKKYLFAGRFFWKD